MEKHEAAIFKRDLGRSVDFKIVAQQGVYVINNTHGDSISLCCGSA